jgi:hypothetical protein
VFRFALEDFGAPPAAPKLAALRTRCSRCPWRQGMLDFAVYQKIGGYALWPIWKMPIWCAGSVGGAGLCAPVPSMLSGPGSRAADPRTHWSPLAPQ